MSAQQWHANGNPKYSVWKVDGKFHRTDGPAMRHWDNGGSLQFESWYIEGKCITEVKFRRMIARKSLQDKILRSSCLLTLGEEVHSLPHDTLSVIGGFLE